MGGGGMGGMGGMGGDPAAGGAPGAPPPGGPVPAGPMGGDMGGMGAAPAGGAAAASNMGGSAGKVLAGGRSSKLQAAEEEQVQPTGVRLTSLEQIMYKMLLGMRQTMSLPFTPWIQYPLGPYRADFAIPQLKLAIECDGEAWHSHPDKKAKDKIRDAELARFGWTTVRFSEVDLKERKPQVQNSVASLVIKLWKKALEQQKSQEAQLNHSQKAAGVSADHVVLGTVIGPEDSFKLATYGGTPITAICEANFLSEEEERTLTNGHTD